MMADASFTEEVLDDYVRQGWKLDKPGNVSPFPDFAPDYVLVRDDQHLAVQIKQPGDSGGPTIAAARRMVEARPNWRYEVKLVPPGRQPVASRIAGEEVPGRLDLAAALLRDGRGNDAFLMAWVAAEAALRSFCDQSGNGEASKSIPDLFRAAYEWELVSLPELHRLQRALELRNRVVHGYWVEFGDGEGASFLDLARCLADRTRDKRRPAA